MAVSECVNLGSRGKNDLRAIKGGNPASTLTSGTRSCLAHPNALARSDAEGMWIEGERAPALRIPSFLLVFTPAYYTRVRRHRKAGIIQCKQQRDAAETLENTASREATMG